MTFFEEVLGGLDYRKASFTSRIIKDINWLSGNIKDRKIYMQNDTMMHLQKHLLTWIRKQNFKLPYATGAVIGGSPFRNILKHKRKNQRHGGFYFPRYFYSIDLKDAYQSVNLYTLASILIGQEGDFSSEVEDLTVFLIHFCSGDELGLAQGATASPDLFNVYCDKVLDRVLGIYCKMLGITYTRYLDDLLFSSDKKFSRKMKAFIRSKVKIAGFQINEKKTRSYDMEKGNVVINGIGLKSSGDMYIPRRYTDHLRGLLHKVLSGKGNDIPEQTIRGKINVFVQCLNANNKWYYLNRTEKKVYSLCCRYLNLQKEIKKVLK